MNDYLDIFSDALRIVTFQPRYPGRPGPNRDSCEHRPTRWEN